MKLNHLKGFSLIELIVAISISTIIIGGIFTIYSNINYLEKITTKKSYEAIKIAYAYNLLKNDLSNSIPGIINDELKFTLNCCSYSKIDQLIKDIKKIIKPNQIILLKGSNGTGLWKLVPVFKNIIQENVNAA